jgi:aspartate/methionine/tyrosine aminotransferase
MADPTTLSPHPPRSIRQIVADLPVSKIGEVSWPSLGDPSVLPLWYGESDLPTPAFICDAAAEAMRRGETFYTHKRGIPPLREAIAAHLTGLHAHPVGVERIAVTSAGMNAIMLVCQCLVDPGDNVVIVSPVWPNVNSAVEVMGGEARTVGLSPTEEGGWKLDLDRLVAACDARTRAIFVNSPSNPTGWMLSRGETERLLAIARQRGLWLIADEVYSRLVYEGRTAPSFLDIADPEDRVVVIQSFSKPYAMTGWRLGWLVAPAELHPILDKVIEFNTSGAPTFLQPAGIAALRDGEAFVASFVERCRRGRDLVIRGLARFPRVRCAAPQGAFYAFFSVDGMTDSVAFAKRLVAENKVGLAPGAAFGRDGEGYLRLCFASAEERLVAALERLAPALA